MARRRRRAGSVEQLGRDLLYEGAGALGELAFAFVARGVAQDVARLKGRALGRRSSSSKPSSSKPSRSSSSPESSSSSKPSSSGEVVELVEVDGVWVPAREAGCR